MTLRQRQPREEDSAWLAIVRKMPCMVCRRPGPSDPAHLRSAARQYGKPHTGMGEKPDDRWVLPLCRTHHDEQHRGNELSFWRRHGFHDPFAEAVALYAARPNKTPPRERKRILKVKPRKPKSERAAIPSGRPMAGTRASGFKRRFDGTLVQRNLKDGR
jgi:hypothetical protein